MITLKSGLKKGINCGLAIILYILSITTVMGQSLNGFNLKDASVPLNEIMKGGPPRDGIPSIDNPVFINSDETSDHNENDRILGVFKNGVAKAYPIRILNYHEIVNDYFRDEAIVITYCPLCGSGIAFKSSIDGSKVTFGVSGLLYNSDVLMYDRETQSLWSQLLSEAISGPNKGNSLEPLATSNTTWGKWKSKYPNSLILSENTGHSRNYFETPYSGYDESNRLYFPVSYSSNQYHNKELVVAIELEGKFKAYPFSELKKSSGLVTDVFNGHQISIEFDSEVETAYIFDASGKELLHSTMFWFAWHTFHPNSSVYQHK